MEPTLSLDVTFEELSALHKTIGIAIDNLNSKVARLGTDSHRGSDALSDLNLLANIQRQILDQLTN
jgi:hypothetical protein